ncbi:MAG: hypothetical protein A3G34_09880 [Candidatus Lindowbacteria bacterium RIFCSPLOWO2_12_FULL_62_27]|nr:MAG: hypothetical protein A3G34_09880 [Candidatus Lindowbacteria bacterium RIFCSPLOWO2_12_FULL_62_27]OGH61551.1 MAG: hypothetical protein A3I06_02885 [Candidatus Lindowbacteria bacterium RIFCSPLOWO2_02_FULL_62_12]
MSTTFWKRTVPILALAVGFAACGGKAEEDVTLQTAGPAAKKSVDAATAGSVSGKVMFTGATPKMGKLDMGADAFCAGKHAETVRDQSVMVNSDGTLMNVVVYVKKGLEEYSYPAPAESPMLDQNGCMYTPHILVMKPGVLKIKSSDNTLHNVHAEPKLNQAFNRAQPTPSEIDAKFSKPEIISFKCDVHPWMRAYVAVLESPAAVTGADGAFKLEMIPPGQYTLEAWHEKFGAQESAVTVETGKTVEANFTFSAPGA